LLEKSEEVFAVLEITGEFQRARSIFIYNSLSDEVSTTAFIEKWEDRKDFYLPVVDGNDLFFCKYSKDTAYKKSSLGVFEPNGESLKDHSEIDIIIVPGVAFDRKMNRMGRGKGYYDRFLAGFKAKKIGICFDYQLFDDIPCDRNDIKMDIIISENDLIW